MLCRKLPNVCQQMAATHSSRQSFFSSRRNSDSPITSPAGECAPPPLFLGVGHTRLRERAWGSPNSDEGTYTMVLYMYIYVYFVARELQIRHLLYVWRYVLYCGNINIAKPWYDMKFNYLKVIVDSESRVFPTGIQYIHTSIGFIGISCIEYNPPPKKKNPDPFSLRSHQNS